MSNIALFIMGAVVLIVISYTFTKAKKPLLTALKSSACGIGGLLLVNLTSSATGCYIAVNLFTIFVSSVLSLPGVVAMLFLNLLFI